MIPQERTVAGVILELDRLLGFPDEVSRALQTKLSASQAAQFIWAGQHVVDYAPCIAAFSKPTRMERLRDWKRIHKMMKSGQHDQAIKDLYSFGEEVRCCALYDMPLEALLRPLGAVWLVAAIPLALATGAFALLASIGRRFQSGFFTRLGSPPRAGEMLLFLVLPDRERRHALGDLEEEFREFVVPRFGKAYATGWYWGQVVSSIFDRTIARLLRWIVANFRTFLAELIAALMKGR